MSVIEMPPERAAPKSCEYGAAGETVAVLLLHKIILSRHLGYRFYMSLNNAGIFEKA